jgi:hypothetical protein
MLSQLMLQGVLDLIGTAGDATGSGAKHKMHTVAVPLLADR